jgi:hypothetical protein
MSELTVRPIGSLSSARCDHGDARREPAECVAELACVQQLIAACRSGDPVSVQRRRFTEREATEVVVRAVGAERVHE